jgi:hypothetical protein
MKEEIAKSSRALLHLEKIAEMPGVKMAPEVYPVV